MTTPKNIHSYSLAMLLTLYIAQGLPVGFMTQALPTLLRHYGVSLAQIGFSGLLMLPWAIKFLWAPYVDRYGCKKFGHYRSWILFSQSLTLICLLILAFVPVHSLADLSALWFLFFILFLINLFCAMQDVATDGLAVHLLRDGAVHWGNTFQVMGSRLGFIFGGGAVLYAIDVLSWQSTFLLLTLGVVLNSSLILVYKEPNFYIKTSSLDNQQTTSPKLRFLTKLKATYGDLWASQEMRLWLIVVLTYKLADGLAGPILKPMMVDMGLSLSKIGIYVTMIGAACAVCGAILAGWLIKRFSLVKMFLLFSFLQSLTFIYYIVLAHFLQAGQPLADHHAYMANALEEFCAAMSLVAMLSLIMKHTRAHFSATDFTVQVAFMSIIGGSLYIVGGIFADYVGYSLVLYLVFFISFVCFLIKIYWAYMNKVY